MSNFNDDLFQSFQTHGFELLFADVLQPKAYASCCKHSPHFQAMHNDLTGTFYDDLEAFNGVSAFTLAVFGHTHRGDLGGFYCGVITPLKALFQSELAFKKTVSLFMADERLMFLYGQLKDNDHYQQSKVNVLSQWIQQVNNDLAVSSDLRQLGCMRAALWLENYALSIKKNILSHLEAPAFKNNLPMLIGKLTQDVSIKSPIKKILLAFYRYKKANLDVLDTSPFFFLMDKPHLAADYKALFEPFYVDDMTHSKSQKGICLFDVNEISTAPQSMGLSAFAYSLKLNKLDIAYALFRSKAQFTQQEFSKLVQLTLLKMDNKPFFNKNSRLDYKTFQTLNELIENQSGTLCVEYIKRSRHLFHAWLVRCSDLQRQTLFLSALNEERLSLALTLSNTLGVNINTKANHSGKTLLHIAIEHENKEAVCRVAGDPNCDLNCLDGALKHPLEKSLNPCILAPVIYYLLERSGDRALSFMARNIKPLLTGKMGLHSHSELIMQLDNIKNELLLTRGT